MSTTIQLAEIKLSRERVAVHYVSPFEDFARLIHLRGRESQRFLDYVGRAGGCMHTDLTTLSHLFDVWKEKGRP
jgi:hypothetical protein